MQRDVRKIWLAIKRHWYLAWPLILANIATPLLALSDVAIAGHLTEAKYLASVTIGAELITFIFWIFGLFSSMPCNSWHFSDHFGGVKTDFRQIS